jgi:hypothetical protein
MSLRIASRAMVCALVLAGSLMAVPASAAGARVYVRIGPPAPIVEVRGAAPSPNHLWVPGYHAWNGTAYVWTPGHWVARPRARAVWVPGRWVHARRGWYLVEGHWR